MMSRIAIAEVEDFLEKLKKSNTEASRWLTDFQQAVIAYTNESRVSGEAVDRSKAYYEASYVPLVETVLQAMTMSEELLAQYIQDFYSQVDATPDMFINAERLQDVMEDVRRLER
ncbi:T7SS effector LXG polymorphic toxin, partial [Listeria sp. ILCC797]|uniref:T7SS effector LXG polymorphic toxin n=1 Tax=Listeria sp. ILCC797 TaxID=1918333 RepID=UPI001C6FCA27